MLALRSRLGLKGREIFADDPVNSHSRVAKIEKGDNQLTGVEAVKAYALAARVQPGDILEYRDGKLSLDTLLSRQSDEPMSTDTWNALIEAFASLCLETPEAACGYAKALQQLSKLSSPPKTMTTDQARSLIRTIAGEEPGLQKQKSLQTG